ncbi:phosphoribosylformylglycinamidine synthase subunit PurL [Candidatus Curtissbacteria bacterium]|nr:phosphoribosylformylglycinamidine synthase subunit PurL [Candidatus Curtissbacteria bacterium]
MIHQISITAKSKKDPLGQDLLAEIKRTLGINNIKNIRTAKIYRLQGVSLKKAQEFTQKVLFEPIDQVMSFDKPLFNDAGQKIEVAYKLGVMNPEVGSLLKSAIDLGINLEAADASRQYAFYGGLTKEQLAEIAVRLLVNKTVEQIIEKPPKNLIITGKVQKTEKILIRNMNDSQLVKLSKDKLFLNLEEMKVIQNYFKKIKRDPTDCEIEVLAQTWSEHCVHKTFKAKLIVDGKVKKPLIERIKATIKNNPKIVVSAFVDNAGVIDFYDGFAINGKVETHNSPSAIEPYGGAMTGSGGVFRDILGTGQGAKVVASTDIFCFAPPNTSSKLIPPGCLPPDYLLRKVVAGVRDYGNRVGIPTNNGSVHFHQDFRAKPTVAAGAYGIVPKKQAKKQWPKKGDLILTIGGRTGRDGIHGATFSSGEMTDRTISVSGSAVQIGNAIEEKRMIDAILTLRQNGLVRTLTDCGAGGYSSAVGEMGQKIGARVYLEKVLLKYTGLAPWEIFLSESQERMVLCVSPRQIKKVKEICQLYNVEVTAIGKFDGSKRLKVLYKDQVVCDLAMKFLHEGLPQRKMIGTTAKKQIKEKLPAKNIDLENIWQKIMSHGNVCSKEPIVRMYDHTVQGTSSLPPLCGVNQDAPNDGAVIRPILKKPYGLVITHGLNPSLNKIDPYKGSIWAILEAVSNYVAVGGNLKDAALIDNFIWSFPDEKSLADLDKSVDACIKMAKILKMPFVSGKDSLSSTYRFRDGRILKIPPVLLISVFGKIPDVNKTVSSDFKKIGSTIVLVGKPDINNLGGTVYFDLTDSTSPNVSSPDLQPTTKVLSTITSVIRNGEVMSVHDISEGGLAGSLAEMCFGGDCGAKIDLANIKNYQKIRYSKKMENSVNVTDTPGVGKTRPDFILFNETPGTFLVEVANPQLAQKLFAKVPHYILGQTIADQSIIVAQGSKKIVRIDVGKLKQSWQKPMKEIFHYEA